jgi:hypothetical protein
VQIPVFEGGSAVKREFAFEKNINNSLDCLPMSIKRKLDRVALKIGRDQWLGMKAEERKAIWNLPAETEQECETLILFIRKVLAGHGTEPRPLSEMAVRLSEPPLEVPAAVTESAREVGFLLDQHKWSSLDDEQRYALTKLIDPGKRNKRMRALAEFFPVGLSSGRE